MEYRSGIADSIVVVNKLTFMFGLARASNSDCAAATGVPQRWQAPSTIICPPRRCCDGSLIHFFDLFLIFPPRRILFKIIQEDLIVYAMVIPPQECQCGRKLLIYRLGSLEIPRVAHAQPRLNARTISSIGTLDFDQNNRLLPKPRPTAGHWCTELVHAIWTIRGWRS